MGELQVTDERMVTRAATLRAVPRLAPDAEPATDLAADPLVESLRADLAHAGLHDHLTGLPNRALLLRAIRSAIGATGRVAVLFCDVDRFKLVNDSRSHAIGDTVLMTMASRLKGALQPGDTLGRFGGDELVVVRPLRDDRAGSARELEGVVGFANALRSVAARPIPAPGGPVIVSLSVGVAFGDATTPPDDVLRDADAAMYRAKERGRARIECFDPAIRAEMAERLVIEAGLRRALAADGIDVAYQPIVDLRRAVVVGFEVLARWNDEHLGAVPPDRFVPIAEETRLVHELGARVLARACGGVTALQAVSAWPLSFTVNLAPSQLAEPDLPTLVADTCAVHGVHPCQLTFEITESGLLVDLNGAVENLHRLRALGCSTSLDDFGTGHSSLSHLKHLPLDVVKIDRCFVAGLGAESVDAAVDAAIVASVVKVAGLLGHDVVAEGIEDTRQLRVVRSLGVTHGQGYLFAAARPLAEAEAFLRNPHRATLLGG